MSPKRHVDSPIHYSPFYKHLIKNTLRNYVVNLVNSLFAILKKNTFYSP